MSPTTTPRFLQITVTEPSRRAELARLLESLERQAVDCDLVLVMRGGLRPAPAATGIRIHPVVSPLRISSSHARNLGLDYACRRGLLGAADVVVLPDDDARYPDHLLGRVSSLVLAGKAIVCVPYGPSPVEVSRRRFPAGVRRLTPGLAMRTGSTNNMFLRADVVSAVGRFDEQFGLGATYGSAEDSDYLLRALGCGFPGVYEPRGAMVEHPYKAHRPREYYSGDIAVLAKHAVKNGTMLLLLRRLATGPFRVLLGQLGVAEYGRALRNAAVCLATVALGEGQAIPL